MVLGENIRLFLSSVYSLSKGGRNELSDYKVYLSKEIPCLKESFHLVFQPGKPILLQLPGRKTWILSEEGKGTKNICTALEADRKVKLSVGSFLILFHSFFLLLSSLSLFLLIWLLIL